MQVIITGVINGLSIGLLALGFTVVYLPTRVFFIALAGVYAVAPFVAWSLQSKGWPLAAAAVAGAILGIGVSLLTELLNHRSLDRRKTASGAHLVSSLGIYIAIIQIIALCWGNDPKTLRTGVDTSFQVAGVILTRAQLISAFTALCLLFSFAGWLRFTNFGLRYRGLADNPVAMGIRGFNVGRLRILAFAIAGALASSASLTTALDIGFTPNVGLQALLLAVISMIVGGQRSFLGPVLGGVILGVVRSEVVWFFSARWQEAITFALLSGFLLLRPAGLFGREMRLEAES
jgi:branched-chain amino acid transport system permease protein